MTLCVGTNGVFGLNVEHTWADAPITGHMVEEMLFNEFSRRKYADDGTCDAAYEKLPFVPEKLKWKIDEECYAV